MTVRAFANARPRNELTALAAQFGFTPNGDVAYWAFITQDERDKAAKSGAAMADGCLSADTLVATLGGPRRIDELVGEVDLLTDRGWRRAEVRAFGVKALRAVTLEGPDGSVVVHATANHRWLTSDERWVLTDDLRSGDRIPQVTERGLHTGYFEPADHRVAAATEKSANNSRGVVVVDVESRPFATRPSVTATQDGNFAANGAAPTLLLDHRIEVGIGDSVFAHESTFAANEPSFVPNLDPFSRDTRTSHDARFALASVSPTVRAYRKLRRFLDFAAYPARHGTAVVDRRNGITRPHKDYPMTFRVVSVRPTARVEEVFCAVVPKLHRFALANGVLTGNSYPITTCDGDNSVATAISAVGRGSADHDAIRRHIMKRAKSLGCSSKIPDNWNADGSLSDSPSASAAVSAFAADATPPAATDAPAPAQGDGTNAGDSAVDKAITDLEAACAEAAKAQAGDPDATTDPNDKPVTVDIAKVQAAVDALKAAQATDDKGDAASDKPAATPDDKTPPDAVTAADTAGPSIPVDEHGNIDPAAVCTVPDCQHPASVHGDTDLGDNTGACSTPGCECVGMTIDTDQVSGPSSGDTGDGSDSDDGVPGAPPQTTGQAMAAVPDAPVTVAPVSTMAPATTNPPPAMTGSDDVGPMFTIPVGIILGQMTGEGEMSRGLQPDALTFPVPPAPLMGLATATHDPNGMDMNDPAVIIGRIEQFTYKPGESGTQVVWAQGHLLNTPDGQYFADLIDQMGRLGVSADVTATDIGVEITGTDEFGWPTSGLEAVQSGVLNGFTVCPYPAFDGCYIVLGDGTEQPAAQAIPMHAQNAPDLVAAGGQLIAWHDAPCIPCGDELVASGASPFRPPAHYFADPHFAIGDDYLREILSDTGPRREGGAFAAPGQVIEHDDGYTEVIGHLAPRGVCHSGVSGRCVVAPMSKTDYAYFTRGQTVLTAEGDPVPVGIITCDTGHASTGRGLTATAAMAHYDNTATQAAYVAVGEDEFGIWYHGVMVPNATDAQKVKLRASSLSGDWRKMRGNLELVACLAVNQPGYAHAVVASSGAVDSLVAAGATVMFALAHPHAAPELTDAEVVSMARGPLLRLVRDDAREQIAALR